MPADTTVKKQESGFRSQNAKGNGERLAVELICEARHPK